MTCYLTTPRYKPSFYSIYFYTLLSLFSRFIKKVFCHNYSSSFYYYISLNIYIYTLTNIMLYELIDSNLYCNLTYLYSSSHVYVYLDLLNNGISCFLLHFCEVSLNHRSTWVIIITIAVKLSIKYFNRIIKSIIK